MPGSYNLDTTKLYKIWFSNNREVFLNQENQLRLVKFRNDNPGANIALVYSSALLSAEAQADLKSFCDSHKIKPVDFDCEILPSSIDNPKENQLCSLAKEELSKWVANQGGNPAAASDLLRFSQHIIERYGIYMDFDVEAQDISKVRNHPINAPILLDDSSTEVFRFNNNIVGFATEDGRLHSDALHTLEVAQDEVIKRYSCIKEIDKGNELLEQPNFEELLQRNDKYLPSSKLEFKQVMAELYDCYSEQSTETRSLCGFREFINDINNYKFIDSKKTDDASKDIEALLSDERSKEMIKEINEYAPYYIGSFKDIPKEIQLSIRESLYNGLKEELKKYSYKMSVLEFSGPGALNSILDTASVDKDKVSIESNGLSRCFKHHHAEIDGGDLSWTVEGKARMDKKEREMNKDVTKIQKLYRGYKTRMGIKKKDTDFDCSSVVSQSIPGSMNPMNNKIRT